MLPVLLFVAGEREPRDVERGDELLPVPEQGKKSLEMPFGMTGCKSRWLEYEIQSSSYSVVSRDNWLIAEERFQVSEYDRASEYSEAVTNGSSEEDRRRKENARLFLEGNAAEVKRADPFGRPRVPLVPEDRDPFPAQYDRGDGKISLRNWLEGGAERGVHTASSGLTRKASFELCTYACNNNTNRECAWVNDSSQEVIVDKGCSDISARRACIGY
jgi:hypothetical protein